ncbi:MAG: MFS transporter [Terriglobia bacterium]
MDSETSLIPVSERPSEGREPLHLRYFGLLRSHREFRRLWMAQLISEIGDWFYSLAVYDLLLETTGSGQAVSYAIIIQLLPWFLMTPLAGFLVDRLPRRQLMIVADVARGCVVLGLLLARSAADVGLVYALLGAEVVFASIFEPARSALLPNLTRPEEILPANALSSATWSFALTVGGALGGAVTALLGRHFAFVLNSLSFFVSALLVWRIQVTESHWTAGRRDSPTSRGRAGLANLREGAAYFGRNPRIAALVMVKAGLGCMGGALLLLTFFGERVFPIAGQGALAMGLLYAARGAGAGVGPLLGDHLTGGNERRMWKSVSLGFLVAGMSYVAFSRAPVLPLAMLAVFFAHMGGSNNWVVSTTLLQIHTEDHFRGRVFAVDLGVNMLVAAAATYILGAGLDVWRIPAPNLALGLGVVLLVLALLWLPIQARWGRTPE